MLLYSLKDNRLVEAVGLYEITKINYYLVLVVFLVLSSIGAEFPDYDRKNLASSNKRDIDKLELKYIINKIILKTGGKHRSRHTHSLDLLMIFVLVSTLIMRGFTDINKAIAFVIVYGFLIGWLSHLFADLLTSGGIYIFWFMPKRVSIVPKELNVRNIIVIVAIEMILGVLLVFHNILYGAIWLIVILVTLYLMITHIGMKFKTGEEWESFVSKVITIVNSGTAVISLVYPIIQ